MRLPLLLIAAFLSLAAPGIAQEKEEKDPVKITADRFVVDETAKIATFTGEVVVKRNRLTVWAPKVVVEYGESGSSSIRSFVASGGVRIKTDEQDATGDFAIYNPVLETLRVTGNVIVVNASSTVGGPDLIIDLNANTTIFSGGEKGGRVTGVFTPQ